MEIKSSLYQELTDGELRHVIDIALHTTLTEYLSMSNKQISYYEYMWRYNLSTDTIWEVAFTKTSYGGA